jgi:hypothetical protein
LAIVLLSKPDIDMQTSTPIIDLHVHSTLKPFGNSFYPNNDRTVFTNSSCIWYNDQRTRSDLKFEGLLGIARYRQSDFRSLTDGQVKIAFVSLYPVEKEFFMIRKKWMKFLEKFIGEFASMFGKKRIDRIMAPDFNYFKDLCDEHEFLRCLDGQLADSRKYKLLDHAGLIASDANLLIIPSFEGCHALCDGNDPRLESAWENMEKNVKAVKDWHSPPLFVTFAHHFYNGLCTHARSLFDTAGSLLDQEYGMRDFNFTPKDTEATINARGKKLINLLLSKSNGRRILIDIKHMSREARITYYQMLMSTYKDEKIPVLCSHGALALEDQHEINLHPEDIMMIYRTGGLIGLEMDQRILGYNHKRFVKFVKSIFHPNKSAFDDAAYFFRQIIAIAEPCYRVNPAGDPWRCIALGSDYDGVINPLNHYPDAVSLSRLYQNLIVHLEQYWDEKGEIPRRHNGLDAADVVYRVMYGNAYDFIVENYRV